MKNINVNCQENHKKLKEIKSKKKEIIFYEEG